jgi:hypothetical protein
VQKTSSIETSADMKIENKKMLSLMNIIIQEREQKSEKRRDFKAKGKFEHKQHKQDF